MKKIIKYEYISNNNVLETKIFTYLNTAYNYNTLYVIGYCKKGCFIEAPSSECTVINLKEE